MNEIQLEVAKNEFGWFIQGYKAKGKVVTMYNNDSLLANLVNLTRELYKEMMLEYGAVDSANDISYFATKEEAEDIVPYIYRMLANTRAYKQIIDSIRL